MSLKLPLKNHPSNPVLILDSEGLKIGQFLDTEDAAELVRLANEHAELLEDLEYCLSMSLNITDSTHARITGLIQRCKDCK